MEQTKNNTFTVFILVIVLGVFAASAALIFYLYVLPPRNFPVNTVITIENGSSLKQVAGQFEESGLIKSAFGFETIGWLLKTEKKVKAGEYFFDKKMSAYELMKTIVGDAYKTSLIKVTIPEGFTVANIGATFERLGMLKKEELLKVTGLSHIDIDCRKKNCLNQADDILKTDSFAAAVKPPYASLEGFLFPDTYFVSRHTKPGTLVAIMLENFEKKVSLSLREEAEKSGRNFFEILTMASILEKEAATGKDRKLISGILWKRLKNNMPLQTDASLYYITGKASADLTQKDLEIDSPYNTYLYKGLPLGPIANPGLSSIEAALEPEESPYLYYLSDKDGKMHYGVTYQDHLANKKKYLK